jgi:hypothetical protein
MISFILYLFALAVLFVIADKLARYFVKWEDRQSRLQRQYETLYREIQNDILYPSTSDYKRDEIRDKLIRLNLLKWKNKEKTKLLEWNYLKKFYRDEKFNIEKLSVTEQLKEVNKNRV